MSDFAPGGARRDDPDTSHDAAESINVTHVESECAGAVRHHEHEYDKGLTSREIAHFTQIDWGTVTPRLRPLARKGILYDSGERRMCEYGKWKGKGREGIVWRHADFRDQDTPVVNDYINSRQALQQIMDICERFTHGEAKNGALAEILAIMKIGKKVLRKKK